MFIVYILLLVILNFIMVIYGYKSHFFNNYQDRVYLPVLEQFGSGVNIVLWGIHGVIQVMAVYFCTAGQRDLVTSGLFLTLTVLLFYTALFDLAQKVIPNKLVLFLLGLRIFWWLAELCITGLWQRKDIVVQGIYTLLLFLILLVVVLAAKGGFGFGDVKLLVVLSLYWDYSMLMSVVMTALLGALAVSLYMMAVKKGSRKDTIPFVPFLYLGFAANMAFLIN